MLTTDQIVQLMDEVAQKGLGRLEIERAGFRLRIDGAPAPMVYGGAEPLASPSAAPAQAIAAAATAGETATLSSAADIHVITSPIVGTFYEAPSPEAEPFASVGAQMAVGQIICIVEAMKLMNEIEADVAGEVVEVYARNGEPVEFGAPLFGVRTPPSAD